MRIKMLIVACISLLVIMFGIALGSVYIPLGDIFRIIGFKAVGAPMPAHIRDASVSILWSLRLPRALLAFVSGGALSVSGAVMQSVLRNPLASPYTIGVSSGASLGACIVILFGIVIPGLGGLTLPFVGFVFGFSTILLAIAFASRLDGQMANNTIILAGFVFSLFVNAITTLLSALQKEHLQRLLYWQMGSFSMKEWRAVIIIAPIAVVGAALVTRYHRELDIMTFGEEQAKTMGVNLKRVKWVLLIVSAALTGSVIAFAGVIGFVDLVAPHVVRKLFGSSHKLVVPMSAVLGGAFMVLCDLVARVAISANELPVGAVTALIGAPFFTYIYFGRKKNAGIA